MARLRAYISSTYDDLLPYRKIAARLLIEAGHVPVDSYKAGSKPTLEQCLADVRSCEVLIGIVGHRKGWVPDAKDGRSITQREFDEAKDKIRLIFLKDSRHIDLDVGIRSFRDDISKKVLPDLFSDYDSFSQSLRKTIKDRLPPGSPVPNLLPFLCDRDEQFKLIDCTLWARSEHAMDRPTIFVVHGDVFQCGSEFVDVLANQKLLGVTKIELTWPKNPATTDEDLLGELSTQLLGKPQGSRESVAKALTTITEPVLVHTFLSTSEWLKTGEAAVTAFVDFWNKWHDLRRTTPLVICLRVRYQIETRFLRFLNRRALMRTNDEIRKFWSMWPATHWADKARLVAPKDPWKTLLFEVLPELSRVDESATVRWSRLNQVREITDGRSLENNIRDLYRDKFGSEPKQSPKMEPLARALKELLQDCS